MPSPSVHPITSAELLEVGGFLHDHLDATRNAAQWAAVFAQQWCDEAPNHGFLLRDGAKLVGVIGAFYARRHLRGSPQSFCNISCWSVLPDYRRHSLRLAVALTSQKGWHFSDFTPTKVVADSLKFLKFRRLDTRQLEFVNLPSWRALRPGLRVADGDVAAMAALLPEPQARVARDHAAFPWLRQLVLADGRGAVHVVYKPVRTAGREVAVVLGVSDREAFTRLRTAFGHQLLLSHGIVRTRVDERYLIALPRLARARPGPPRKLCLADGLADHEVDDLYSELACIDLPAQFY